MMQPHPDPFAHFDAWFEEARAAERLPEAAALATVDERGQPSNRMVLVRWRTAPGFDVYTDLESRKGEHLRTNPSAALCWYWPALDRQVRADGRIEFLDDAHGDAYWYGRPREAQLSAAASHQSAPIESREALQALLAAARAEHAEHESVPRPPRWGGIRLIPDRIEFWQQENDRLHDRLEYRLEADGSWSAQTLQP